MGGIRTASKGVSTIFCIGFIILSTVWISCRAVPVIPDLPFECYSSTGDLNLGVLTDPTRGGSDGGYCGNERFYTRSMQNMEAIIWTLNRINQREDLLPNITLGYVITNACNNKMVALARSTYFIPEPEKTNNETFRVQTDLEKNCAGGPMTFDVVGVIGNGFSPTAVMAAGLLGLYQVAYLDTLASSDDLSDKRWYPYYLRLVPPDRYLVSAMMDFIAHHKWTYASIIYSEGSWGENAEKLVQATAKEMGLCIPVAERVRIGATREDLEPVLEKLLTHSNARVVINFLYDSQRPVLWALIGERNLTGKFIWVAGDSMAHEDEGEAADGTFVMFQVSKPVPEYAKHYLSLTPKNTPDNPWMPKLWEELYECTWDDVDIDNITNIGDNSTENGVRSCNAIEDKPFMNRRVRDVSSIFCDTVLVFAHAMHALITDQCPEAFQNKDILKTCIHRPDILAYLRATDLEGYNGRTQFDENGDKFGQYSIRQYFHDNPDLFTEVAFWDQMTDTLTFYPDDIKWDIFSRGSSSEDGIPESVCSQPCKPREYAIRQELACCWECLTCRDTEILVEVRNKTRCDRCPVNMWPDDLTATTCEVIDPTYLTWGDPASIALVLGTLAILGLTIATMLWFIKHRRIKLVKASSKDLSGLILFGILLANLTVPFFIVRPSLFWCSISRAGFGISVTLIYGPLLVKTTRIYRIFAAGKNGTGKPRFISNRAQLVAAMLLLLIQVCLILVSAFLAPPTTSLRMPVLTVRYVELYCNLPLKGLLPMVTFNLLLLSLCALFGFLTRKLPENFNESWYIFVSVSTTLFLWGVFLPTYFNTFYIVYRVVLLSCCLIINATVTLTCLFVPKMYAVHFVGENTLFLSQPGTSGVSPAAVVQRSLLTVSAGVSMKTDHSFEVPSTSTTVKVKQEVSITSSHTQTSF